MHLYCLTQLISKNLNGNEENALLKNEIQQKLLNVKKYALTKISMYENKTAGEHVFQVHREDCEILTFRMRPGFLEAKLDNNDPVKIIEVLNLSSKYASLKKEIPLLEDFVEIIRIRCIIICNQKKSLTDKEKKLFSHFLLKIEKETKGNPDNYEDAFDKIGEIVDYKNNQKLKDVYNQKIRDFKEYFENVCHPDLEIVEPAFKKSRCYSYGRNEYLDLKYKFPKKSNTNKNKSKKETEKDDKDEKEQFNFSNCYKIEIDYQAPQIYRDWKNCINLKILILKNWNPSKAFIPWKELEAGLQIWQKLTYLDMSNSKLTELPESVILKLPQSLETLRLAGNNIDKLSPAISHLKHLKVLSLSNNVNLNDVGFPWDSLPETLEELYLENTNLKIIQSAINRLNLKKFAVSGKNLNVISWKSFPSKIEELYISCGNNINRLEDLKYLDNLRIFHLKNANLNVNKWEILPQSLQTIDLSFNEITVLDCHYFLPNLTTVILKNNKNSKNKKVYNGNWENIAKNIPNLVLLDLEGNDFEEFLSQLKCLPKLEVLNLSKNKFGSIQAEKLPSSLKELYLSENKINSITSIELLENLKILNLTKNALNSKELNTAKLEKLEKLQFLFLAGNKLTSLPHGFENLINLRFLDLSYNNFRHNLKNISNYLWNRLPKFISTLYLSGNNLGELPCQLSKISLDFLEANDCSLQRICPQLQKYTSNENPKIFESSLFDGKKVIDVRKNDDLLQLSFVPNKIYSPPTPPKPKNESSVTPVGYGEANFVLVTDFCKKFQNTDRFPIKKLKPFYDFSEKHLALQENAQICQCCAQCGAEEGGMEIETVMVMDFCLATVKEETVADVTEEENLMILEIPIKPSEDIRTYKMSESWKRALKNRTTLSDCALTKLLPKQWKSKIRTKMCQECIESIKIEISESCMMQQEQNELKVSTPSLSETNVTKKTRKCAKQRTVSHSQESNDVMPAPVTNITVNENPLQGCVVDSLVTAQPLPSIEILQSNLNHSNSQYSIIDDDYEFFPEISNLPNTYCNQTEHNSTTESPFIYSNSQTQFSPDECYYSMDNYNFCPDSNSVNNNYLNDPSSSGLNSGYPPPIDNDMQNGMYFNNHQSQSYPTMYSFDQEGHQDINDFVYTFPEDQD